MSRILKYSRVKDVIAALAVFISLAALVMFPSEAVSSAKDGLELCMNVIIPSLFPFFVLSNMIVELGLIRYIGRLLEGLMRPVFNVGGNCAAAFALGIIGGYPVGAKTAINLYEKGWCSKSEAERLLSFCNNSGPAFILGVVGAGIFSSSKIGLMLYLAHIAASIVVGVIFRFHRSKDDTPLTSVTRKPTYEAVRFTTAFTESVKNAFSSTLSICGFVIFFTVVIRMLFLTGVIGGLSGVIAKLLAPAGFGKEWAEKLLIGLIEISSGVWSLQSAAGTLTGKLSMAAFILGWAGLSVHFQVLSFIGTSGLSTKTYIGGKALHGIISAVFVYFLSNLLPLEAPVSHYLAQQLTGIAALDFTTALTVSSITAVVVWLVIAMISMLLVNKGRYGKRE